MVSPVPDGPDAASASARARPARLARAGAATGPGLRARLVERLRNGGVDQVIWIILCLTIVPVALVHLVARLTTVPDMAPKPGSRAEAPASHLTMRESRPSTKK